MTFYIILFYIISIPIASYIMFKDEKDNTLFEALEDFFNQIGPGVELDQY